MLDSGAVPSIGICVLAAFEKQFGHSASTALRNALVVEKEKRTLAEIIPATKVPCPSLPKFEQPSASPTKSSQPTTDPSDVRCGNPGRMPESMTATVTPWPANPAACCSLTWAI